MLANNKTGKHAENKVKFQQLGAAVLKNVEYS